MLDIQYIREHADAVTENAKKRKVTVDIQRVLSLDEQVKSQTQALDQLRAERNSVAEQLPKAPEGEKPPLVQKGQQLKKSIAEQETALETLRVELKELLMQIPNMTHPDSPVGKDDAENVQIRVSGEPTQFSFTPKDHLTLGTELDVLDFETGAEVAGHGFYYVKNEGALLELALIQYAMGKAMEAGFQPMITPDLAYQKVLQGTGFNPRGNETQIYNVEGTDLSLIATAEITVAGYYQNHTFSVGELDAPKKIVALSHCFRTEAGSYGRESKGLYRVHQFTKVEMFVYCKPEDSERMHQELLAVEERIMQGLQIPYRVVDICTGDLGGPAYRKYDLEAWMPFRTNWGEVTSTSNCTDYQARRLNIKYKTPDGKKALVHTLNGTAIVTSRVPICILENFQQPDGTVKIPAALHPYMHGVTEIRKK